MTYGYMRPNGGAAAWATSAGVLSAADLSRASERSRQIATRSIILANSNIPPTNPPGAVTPGGWRINDASGGVLSLDSTMRRRGGIDVIKVDATSTLTGDAVFKSLRIKTEVLTTHNGVIGIWVFIPVLSAGALNLVLRWSSDAPAADPPNVTPTNYYSLQFNAEGQQRGVWSFLSVSGPTGKIFGPSNPGGVAVTTTGSPVSGQIRQIDLIESWSIGTPAAERVFWIDNIEANGKAKPMIVIGHDGFGDGATSIANKLAALDKYGIPAYIAGDGNSAAGSAATLAKFYDRGGDVISQGMNHTDYGLNPSMLSADFDAAKAILTGLGFTRSLDLFAYPFNSRSTTTDAVVRAKGVRVARSTLGNWRVPFNVTGTIDLLSIGSANTDNKTAAQMQAIVDEAVASGSHLFLYGHSVTSSAGSSTNMNLTEFNAMIDYIGGLYRAGTVDVVSASEFANRLAL